jgi:hypothetical protein
MGESLAGFLIPGVTEAELRSICSSVTAAAGSAEKTQSILNTHPGAHAAVLVYQ